MRSRITALIASLLTVAALTACTGGSTDDDPPKGSNASTTEDREVEETEPPPVENPTFGESFTWDDDVSITISKPKEFRIGQYAAMTEKWPAYVAFDVVVVNGTTQNVDASVIYFSMQSKDVEAEEVFDSENGFNGTPSTPLLPGRQARFKVGFGVTDPADLVMSVSLNDMEHEDVVFTN